jgi:hypothetical protein
VATADSILQSKKDSGSARQGETANTETCHYPNRLNLSPLTAARPGAFEKFCDFRKNFRALTPSKRKLDLAAGPVAGGFVPNLLEE